MADGDVSEQCWLKGSKQARCWLTSSQCPSGIKQTLFFPLKNDSSSNSYQQKLQDCGNTIRFGFTDQNRSALVSAAEHIAGQCCGADGTEAYADNVGRPSVIISPHSSTDTTSTD